MAKLYFNYGAMGSRKSLDLLATAYNFEEKNIPAWFDVWGEDVAHDWPWWRIQMPYFLDKLNL